MIKKSCLFFTIAIITQQPLWCMDQEGRSSLPARLSPVQMQSIEMELSRRATIHVGRIPGLVRAVIIDPVIPQRDAVIVTGTDVTTSISFPSSIDEYYARARIYDAARRRGECAQFVVGTTIGCALYVMVWAGIILFCVLAIPEFCVKTDNC